MTRSTVETTLLKLLRTLKDWKIRSLLTLSKKVWMSRKFEIELIMHHSEEKINVEQFDLNSEGVQVLNLDLDIDSLKQYLVSYSERFSL